MVENVSPRQAWENLAADPQAQLVDVRSEAEWVLVGLPALGALGRAPLLVAWQPWPGTPANPDFLDHLQEAGAEPERPLYFLCRTGGRSAAAAHAAEAAGYTACFNVLDGFEGPADAAGHRGTTAGWKAAGLPWRQR